VVLLEQNLVRVLIDDVSDRRAKLERIGDPVQPGNLSLARAQRSPYNRAPLLLAGDFGRTGTDRLLWRFGTT
jgi:hypothetical protein